MAQDDSDDIGYASASAEEKINRDSEQADPDAAEDTSGVSLDEDDPDSDDYRRADPYSTLAFSADAAATGDDAPGAPGDEEDRQTPEERAENANRHMVDGQINEALNYYRQAVRKAPDAESSVEHRVTLGDAYAYSGQALNAFRQYRRAIKTSPRKAEPHFSLAELYQRYGRLQSAIGEYRKAITFAPENAYYRYKLGDALALSGDLEGAVSELEEATHLKPQDGFYHFWLGDLYAQASRFEEAVREMQQATIFSPYDAYYNVRLGVLYRRVGQTRDAVTALRHAVEITPENGAYHCLLADLYGELRSDAHAIHHYQLAGRLDAYDTDVLRRLRRLSGMEEDEEALLALEAPEGDE